MRRSAVRKVFWWAMRPHRIPGLIRLLKEERVARTLKKEGRIDLSVFLSVEPLLATPSDKIRVQASQWINASNSGDFSTFKRKGRIAVVLHLHYADLWPELRDKILNIPEPFDLLVSLHEQAAEQIAALIHQDFPGACVLKFENRGRDILPLVAMINAGLLREYDVICKIHTKKSLGSLFNGAAWRRVLVDGVLGSRRQVQNILDAFDQNKSLGIVAADSQLRGAKVRHWMKNFKKMALLCQRAGLTTTIPDEARFVAGTMFWIRASLLRPIEDMNLTLNDFEVEPIGVDGAMAHAMERMFGLVTCKAGMQIGGASLLLQSSRNSQYGR